MALQTVSKELAEHLGTGKAHEQMTKPDQQRMLTMLFWGVVALVVGMGVIAVGKHNDTVGLLGLLLVLGGTLLAFYGLISHLRAAALVSRQGAQLKALPQSEPDVAGAAKSFPEIMPSVTELTTRNLDATPETKTEERAGNTQPTV